MNATEMPTEVGMVELIVTRIARRGSGIGMHSPVREIVQFWTKSGTLLVEVDRAATTLTPEDKETLRLSLGEILFNKNFSEDVRLDVVGEFECVLNRMATRQ